MENNEQQQPAVETAKSNDIDYKAEYEKLLSENEKNKRLKDQYSKESADWKNKYNATLSDVEKERIAQEEKEKHYKELEREFNLGKLKNSLSKTINNDEISNTIAGYMLDGNLSGAVEEMNKYFANHDEELSKQMTEKLLKKTPDLPPQNPSQAKDLKYYMANEKRMMELNEMRDKNPTEYNRIINNK